VVGRASKILRSEGIARARSCDHMGRARIIARRSKILRSNRSHEPQPNRSKMREPLIGEQGSRDWSSLFQFELSRVIDVL
jgi:hypothetical protein